MSAAARGKQPPDAHAKRSHSPLGRSRAGGSAITATSGARERFYRRQRRAAKALSSLASHNGLAPEEYRRLSKKGKIGGQLRRDVDAFRTMLQQVDPGKTGRVSFESFMAEVERHTSGPTTLTNRLRGHAPRGGGGGGGRRRRRRARQTCAEGRRTEAMAHCVLL